MCSIFILGRSSIQAWLKLRRDWATGKLIASRTSLSLSDLYPWQFTLAQSNWQNRLQWWYPTTPSLRTDCDSGYLWVDPWRVVPHLSSLWQLSFLTAINRTWPTLSSECSVYRILTTQDNILVSKRKAPTSSVTKILRPICQKMKETKRGTKHRFTLLTYITNRSSVCLYQANHQQDWIPDTCIDFSPSSTARPLIYAFTQTTDRKVLLPFSI